MDRIRKEHNITATIVLVVGLLVVPMLACNFDFNINDGGEPSIKSIVLTRRLDERQRPVDATTVFRPTDAFFCSVEVANLETGTEVSATWFRGEQSLDQFTLTADTAGSGYLGFNLSSRDGLWPTGDYRVEIQLDDVHAGTAEFSVKTSSQTPPSQARLPGETEEADEGPAATTQIVAITPFATPAPTPASPAAPTTPTAISTVTVSATSEPAPGFLGSPPGSGSPTATASLPPVITAESMAAALPQTATSTATAVLLPVLSPIVDVTLSRQIDENQKPVQPTTVFDQKDAFFCSVEVAALEAGSRVTARWYYGEEMLDEFTLTTDTAGSGHLGFNLAAEDGIWPIGDYSVSVELNGAPTETAPFSVKAPDGAIPSEVKSAIMTRGVDDNYRATEPTLVFAPSDSIHCSVNADLGLGSQLTAEWYDGGELMEEYLTIVTAQENMSDTYVDFYLTPSEPLAPGPYAVRILLDGQLTRAMDFTVREVESPVHLVTPIPLPIGPTSTAIPLVQQPGAMEGPGIGPVAFSAAVTDEHEAVSPGTSFPDGTTTVFATFEYHGFTDSADFEQIWYLDGAETARGSLSWDGTQSGHYEGSLYNEDGLLTGIYRLDISLNGQHLGSGEFTIGEDLSSQSRPTVVIPTAPLILSPSPTSPQPPTIGPINFSSDGLTATQPVVPRRSFPAGTTVVYATFSYSDFLSGDSFEQVWYLNEEESGRGSFAWADAQTGQYQGTFNNDDGLLPGKYRLDILLNGVLLGSGQFEVEGAPSPTATPTRPSQPAQPTATTEPATPRPEAPVRQAKVVYTMTEGNVHSLWTMNLDGSDREMLTEYASDPSWAPDGNSIVFYGWDGHPRGANGIYEISSDGSTSRRLWNQGSAEYLDWAASGRYIAMNTIAAGTPNKRLVVYDDSQGQWQDIGPGEQPCFSPDGNNIVARTCLGSTCGLFMMDRKGEGKWRLTNSADDAMPSWSPTGDRIVYASQRSGNWDIWVINTDGSGQTQLTQDPGIDAMPVWLPDGNGIVYRSTRDGAWGVWVMDADGGNPRKITDAPAAPDWGRDRLDVH